ncbi:MAG: hypothetical protein RI947_655 [Candidatus Parcubacteria bacterium]
MTIDIIILSVPFNVYIHRLSKNTNTVPVMQGSGAICRVNYNKYQFLAENWYNRGIERVTYSGVSSAVEYLFSKQRVTGSNPVLRSKVSLLP